VTAEDPNKNFVLLIQIKIRQITFSVRIYIMVSSIFFFCTVVFLHVSAPAQLSSCMFQHLHSRISLIPRMSGLIS
jgi:hypothetical protein